MKNKVTLVALLGSVLLCLIGGTFAYSTQEIYLHNVFTTKPYSAKTYEEFESPKNWQPGMITDKKVYAQNTNTGPIIVRMSYEELWKNAKGQIIPNELVYLSGKWMSDGKDYSVLIDNNVLPQPIHEGERLPIAIIHQDNDQWEYEEGYYYYQQILEEDEITEPFLGAVQFNPAVKDDLVGLNKDNEYDETLYIDDVYQGYQEEVDGQLFTHFNYATSNDFYSNATYTLTVEVEMIQASQASMKANWKISSSKIYAGAKNIYDQLPAE